MAQNTDLFQKRQILKNQLDAGKYRTINKLIADEFGTQIAKITNHPARPTYGSNVLILTLPLSSLGFLITLIWREAQLDLWGLTLFLVNVIYIFLVQIALQAYIDHSFAAFRNNYLDAMDSLADLEDLERWFNESFDLKKQVSFGVLFSLAVHLGFIALDPALFRMFGWGLVGANVVFNFFHGVCVYLAFQYLFWMVTRLRNYSFDLFPADPSTRKSLSNFLPPSLLVSTL